MVYLLLLPYLLSFIKTIINSYALVFLFAFIHTIFNWLLATYAYMYAKQKHPGC